MDLYNIKNKDKLESIKTKSFKLEKDIQNIVEKNLESLFGLKFVKSEFSVKKFRIDTLSSLSRKLLIIKSGINIFIKSILLFKSLKI